MTTHRSVLEPPPQPIALWLVLAACGHGFVLVFMVVLSVVISYLSPSRPIIDPNRAIEVSMVSLPRSETSLPDRASRAAVDAGEPEQPVKEPEPSPVEESDLEFKKEKVAPDPGEPQRRIREQVQRQQQREDLLQELLSASTGPEDRDATDPNSRSDVQAPAIGAGSVSDPEFAAYKARIQQLFQQHFSPLPAIVAANPGIVCGVRLAVDPATGRVLSRSVGEPSGVSAYDAAAMRAAQAVATIPLPPDRYLKYVAGGYTIRLKPR